jgi:hypothetical protein
MSRTLREVPKPEMTESEAIRRAQGGDAEAFEYLYRSHSRSVYSCSHHGHYPGWNCFSHNDRQCQSAIAWKERR